MFLEKRFLNLTITHFPMNNPALEYIRKCFIENIPIDLIITDYNHPGPNGLLFAMEVRKLEVFYKKKLPLILLTMRWEDEKLSKATSDGIFDIYLPKSIEEEPLTSFIKKSLLT